jgi:hypothetical protein
MRAHQPRRHELGGYRAPSALGAVLLPVHIRPFSFHRICLNLKIWNRLMGQFEYMPVDSRWRM